MTLKLWISGYSNQLTKQILHISVGWRPRRTLLFISWGAEEYGMVGSGEWVEASEFLFKKLYIIQYF